MGDSRDDPRYQALRQAAQRTAQAASVADRLAAKTSGNQIDAGRWENDPLKRDLLAACGNNADKAAKMYAEACRKHGMNGSIADRLKKHLFNR